MNLFTSSSKSREAASPHNLKFIGYSLFFLAILLFLYQCSILLNLVSPSNGISLVEINSVKVERYIFNQNQKSKTVLTGSSLMDNIARYIEPDQAINLGIAGGSSQTGLEIVESVKSKPDLVLVEINGENFDRGIDSHLTASLHNPFLYFFRLHFSMFRQEYKPVSVLVSQVIGMRQAAKRKHENGHKDFNLQADSGQSKNVSQSKNEAKAVFIQTVIAEKNKGLDQQTRVMLEKQARLIQNQIAELQKLGVRVILTMIPGEPSIDNTLQHKQIRDLVISLFPVEGYEWMAEPSKKDWQTSDGVHLTEIDAKEYARFLKEKLLIGSRI